MQHLPWPGGCQFITGENRMGKGPCPEPCPQDAHVLSLTSPVPESWPLIPIMQSIFLFSATSTLPQLLLAAVP